MSWIPLPFPKCPKCSVSWSLTYHRNCPHTSDIEVETILEYARCKPCNLEWKVLDGSFYCSCGHIFTGWEVESAINKTLELKERLRVLLGEMKFDETKIEETTKDSFKSWLNNTSYEIGRKLGNAAGVIVKIISNIFR